MKKLKGIRNKKMINLCQKYCPQFVSTVAGCPLYITTSHCQVSLIKGVDDRNQCHLFVDQDDISPMAEDLIIATVKAVNTDSRAIKLLELRA